MKNGRFLRIPETVDDVALLRSEAAPLDEKTRPEWLATSDLHYYLHIDSISTAHLSAADEQVLNSEIEAFDGAELLVSETPTAPREWRVYVTAKPLYDEWAIGIQTGASPMSLRDPTSLQNPVLSRHDITDTEAVFVADPFMLEHEGWWYMFFEILNWRSNKGEIGYATSADGMHWTYRKRVLVEPFHLSYPYVFRVNNEIYMLPEARQSGAVRLYRATNFPEHWTLCGTFLEGEQLADCSVFFAGDLWWILAADVAGDDCMRIFSSGKISGPWHEHPHSPLFRDSTTFVRPAGRVLITDGKILRFAQNRSGGYGTCVRAFEITALTQDSYAEHSASGTTVLDATTSPWATAGMHHLDAHAFGHQAWFACVDGRS